MSIFETDVAVQKSMRDYCDAREKIIMMLADYYKQGERTNDELKRYTRYGLHRESMPRNGINETIKDIDRSFWREAFERTGFMQLMDAESRKRFDKDIAENPPEFNMQNIRSTFIDLTNNAEQMFNDGIVNVFRRLSGHYKTNDIFKVGEKIIIECAIESGWSRGKQLRYGRSEDELNDIDRALKVLDGKKHNPRELSCAMNTSFQNGDVYECDYIKARAFKNGNLHLWFKRADLLEKINLIIAKHYNGSTISKGRK